MIDISNLKNHTTTRPAGWSLLGDAETFDRLPPLHRQQIQFLDEAATHYLYAYFNAAHLVTGEPWDPFAKGNFKTVERFADYDLSPEGISVLKKWLFTRGIAFKTTVYVLPVYEACPLLTTWKMVIKYCGQLFASDDVVLFDNSLNWCLYFHHDNYFLFGKNNIYDAAADEKIMAAALERKKKFPGYKPPYYK